MNGFVGIMTEIDVVIVGAGIIGAATAWKISQQYPQKRVIVLEKEAECAQHQTGRNSGVIHAGVYYQPGSLKARFCKAGLAATMDFCKTFDVSYLQCGKLIVATDQAESQRMEALYHRSKENELDTRLVSAAELTQLEPNIVGLGGILVKDTGIVDYKGMTRTLLDMFRENGGQVVYGQRVSDINEHSQGIDVITDFAEFKCKTLINCAGLMSDRLIAMQGLKKDFQIIPFRGEYFRLPEKYNQIVKHLIYPVPDPSMPFLGVHLTRMIDGSVTVGPNAVLAMAREGYTKSDVNLLDMWQTLSFKGFWPLVSKHMKSGLMEARNSMFKQAYLKLVQKYCPQLEIQDLLPYPSGVRAQAVNDRGELLHDFKFIESEYSLHVGNAPSPAATSALPIADAILDRIADKLA